MNVGSSDVVTAVSLLLGVVIGAWLMRVLGMGVAYRRGFGHGAVVGRMQVETERLKAIRDTERTNGD